MQNLHQQEALAKKSKCAKCHGEIGISDDPDDINIAGMSVSYLFKQLRDFKDNNRDDSDMFKKVRYLEDSELADIAAWYTLQEPAKPTADRTLTPDIKKLITHGDPKRLLKACGSCHGRDGRGGQFDHPALTGQMKGG